MGHINRLVETAARTPSGPILSAPLLPIRIMRAVARPGRGKRAVVRGCGWC
jgi:hypothetical protein